MNKPLPILLPSLEPSYTLPLDAPQLPPLLAILPPIVLPPLEPRGYEIPGYEHHRSRQGSTSSTSSTGSTKKRRQRSGPLCDLCRIRKVKCDAEIVVLRDLAPAPVSPKLYKRRTFNPADYGMTPEYVRQKAAECGAGEGENYEYLQTPSRLVRFRGCGACVGRGVACLFSKGYTRAEIMKYNRMNGEED